MDIFVRSAEVLNQLRDNWYVVLQQDDYSVLCECEEYAPGTFVTGIPSDQLENVSLNGVCFCGSGVFSDVRYFTKDDIKIKYNHTLAKSAFYGMGYEVAFVPYGTPIKPFDERYRKTFQKAVLAALDVNKNPGMLQFDFFGSVCCCAYLMYGKPVHASNPKVVVPGTPDWGVEDLPIVHDTIECAGGTLEDDLDASAYEEDLDDTEEFADYTEDADDEEDLDDTEEFEEYVEDMGDEEDASDDYEEDLDDTEDTGDFPYEGEGSFAVGTGTTFNGDWAWGEKAPGDVDIFQQWESPLEEATNTGVFSDSPTLGDIFESQPSGFGFRDMSFPLAFLFTEVADFPELYARELNTAEAIVRKRPLNIKGASGVGKTTFIKQLINRFICNNPVRICSDADCLESFVAAANSAVEYQEAGLFIVYVPELTDAWEAYKDFFALKGAPLRFGSDLRNTDNLYFIFDDCDHRYYLPEMRLAGLFPNSKLSLFSYNALMSYYAGTDSPSLKALERAKDFYEACMNANKSCSLHVNLFSVANETYNF